MVTRRLQARKSRVDTCAGQSTRSKSKTGGQGQDRTADLLPFRLARKARGCSTTMVRAKCGSARDRFSSAVSPMWCQRPGVTQRKTVRPGRLHQHVSVQPQRRRGPPIPSASAARVPTASRRTPATPPRRIRRIPASLATPPRGSTAARRGCALLPRTLLD